MVDTHNPIQELVKKARRNQILDAATKVFAEKGFHPTTIKDIAREAGIADGTIYNYFENKTALMLGIFDRLNESDKRVEDFSKFTEVDFRSFMKAYLRHRLTVLQAGNFEVFRVVLSEINISLAMRAISGMVLGLIMEHIIGDQTLETKWDELPDFLTDMILDGLGRDKS